MFTKISKFYLSRPTETLSPGRYGARGISALCCVMTVLMKASQNFKTILPPFAWKQYVHIITVNITEAPVVITGFCLFIATKSINKLTFQFTIFLLFIDIATHIGSLINETVAKLWIYQHRTWYCWPATYRRRATGREWIQNGCILQKHRLHYLTVF